MTQTPAHRRTPTPAAGARIVVGVDGSPAATAALRWAARLAPTLNATIEVVTAWEYPYAEESISTLLLDWEQLSKDAIAASLSEAFGDTPPSGLITTVIEGHPARTILDAAQDATMIVVGSRGLGGFYGLLMGSVSRYVSEHATCPVLVVHEPPDSEESAG